MADFIEGACMKDVGAKATEVGDPAEVAREKRRIITEISDATMQMPPDFMDAVICTGCTGTYVIFWAYGCRGNYPNLPTATLGGYPIDYRFSRNGGVAAVSQAVQQAHLQEGSRPL